MPENKPSYEDLERLVEQLQKRNDRLSSDLEQSHNDFQTLQKENKSIQVIYEKDIAERKFVEESLIKEKEFNQKLWDCLPGIFYMYTYPELRLVHWNKNHETLLGFTADEIRNKYIMDWHVPGVESIVQQAVDLVMEKGENTLESPLLNKKGEYIPFLMTGIKFEIPEQKYLLGFGIDITNQKKIEKAQKESDLLFRLLAENSTDMIARHDEKGDFLYVSPSCKTLLGYDPEELIGHSAFEFIHPEDAIKIEESRKRIIEQPIISTTTFRILCKNGKYIWFETISRSILDETTGKVKEIHASSRDVTERKLNEEKLLETETKFSTLFDSMTEMVALHEVVFDANNKPINYRILDCNNAYTEITGIKKADAVGKLATDVYQTPSAPYLEEFCNVAITGISYEYTSYFAPMDKQFMISVVSPGKNKFATITTDITAIKQIQEAITEKNKELENYLYVASHDLRTPLVNIHGFSQRFQKHIDLISKYLSDNDSENIPKEKIEKVISEEIPRTLNFVFSNVSKMDMLINGLLQISRTGRIKMTIKKIAMEQLIKTIVAGLNYQLTELVAKVEIGNLQDCYGDNAQLNQLFSNVIGNAIKYYDPKKQLIISINSQTRYNKVIYSISDTGLGIATRHQKRIWDVFYRVDSSSSEAGEGLGLSIAKRIADKHKGKIWVESKEGIGSTFYVELLNTEFNE